jgi:hypothetical protein
MPKLPSYEQNVAPATFSAPAVGTGSVNSPAVAGTDATNFGSSVLSAGASFTAMAQKLAITNRNRQDQTALLRADNEYTKWSLEAMENVRGREGEQAFGATDEFMMKGNKLIEEYTKDYDPRIRDLVREKITASHLVAANQVSVFESEQSKVVDLQARAANVELKTNRATGFSLSAVGQLYGNGEVTNHTNADGGAVAGITVEGYDNIAQAMNAAGEAVRLAGGDEKTALLAQQTKQSEIYGLLTTNMISQFPADALAFFEQHEGKIQNAQVRNQLRELAQTTTYTAQGVELGNSLYLDIHLAGSEYTTIAEYTKSIETEKTNLLLNKDKLDPEVLAAATGQLDSLLNSRTTTIQADVVQNVADITSQITEADGDISKVDMNQLAFVNAHDPSQAKAFREYATYLQTRPAVVTDPDVYFDLDEMRVNNPQAFLKENLVLYSPVISFTDLKALRKEQAEMQSPGYYELQAGSNQAVTDMSVSMGYDTSKISQKAELGEYKIWAKGFLENYKKVNGIKQLDYDQAVKLLTEGSVMGKWRAGTGLLERTEVTFFGNRPRTFGKDAEFIPQGNEDAPRDWKKKQLARLEGGFKKFTASDKELDAIYNYQNGQASTEQLKIVEAFEKRLAGAEQRENLSDVEGPL